MVKFNSYIIFRSILFQEHATVGFNLHPPDRCSQILYTCNQPFISRFVTPFSAVFQHIVNFFLVPGSQVCRPTGATSPYLGPPACMAAMAVDEMYCGFCNQALCSSEGQWQQYGDFRADEKRWVFLCKQCSKHFWRLYTKGEPFHDFDHMCREYQVWLKHELRR